MSRRVGRKPECISAVTERATARAIVSAGHNPMAIKRGIDQAVAASGGLVRQTIAIQQGISKEKAKDIIAVIKEAKLKVQAQIQDDQVRVTGKNRDDLQDAIQLLKGKDLDVEMQFLNFRE